MQDLSELLLKVVLLISDSNSISVQLNKVVLRSALIPILENLLYQLLMESKKEEFQLVDQLDFAGLELSHASQGK